MHRVHLPYPGTQCGPLAAHRKAPRAAATPQEDTLHSAACFTPRMYPLTWSPIEPVYHSGRSPRKATYWPGSASPFLSKKIGCPTCLYCMSLNTASVAASALPQAQKLPVLGLAHTFR